VRVVVPRPVQNQNATDHAGDLRSGLFREGAGGAAAVCGTLGADLDLDELVIVQRRIDLPNHGVRDPGSTDEDDRRQVMRQTSEIASLLAAESHRAAS